MAFVANAWAVDPFTVRDIRVEGLQRVEPGTVFASLPFRVGDLYNDEKGSAAIRALFGLGLFKDVRLEVSGDVLVVIVEERPTVADVDFVGTKEFDKDALKKALREIGLTEGRPYDQAPGRPRRAGTQAPVHQQEPVRRRGRDHRDAHRAQPRQPDVHGDRGRAGPHQGNPDRRQQCVQRIDAAGPVRPGHRRLAELVHQVRPLLARQAQRRPGGAALLLPEPRLPGVPHRFHPGGDLAQQAGHLASRSTSPKARGTWSPASGWKATTSGKRGRVQDAGDHPARASPTTPTR